MRDSGNDSLFVPGSACGKDLEWLIDTGCSVTLMSTKVYQGISANQRPKLRSYTGLLSQASGTPMKVLGTAQMTIRVGKQRLRHSIIVADCINQGILGLDFLAEHEGNIDLKSKTIKLGKNEIPLIWQ